MGLATWKNAPQGKVLKSDVAIAKNYLIEKEIKDLERIVRCTWTTPRTRRPARSHMRMCRLDYAPSMRS